MEKNIEKLVKDMSGKDLHNLQRFAYWNSVLTGKDSQYDANCGSCGSFCTGGSCTTCTSVLGEGYLKR